MPNSIVDLYKKRKDKQLYGIKPSGIKFGGLGSSPQLEGRKGGLISRK